MDAVALSAAGIVGPSSSQMDAQMMNGAGGTMMPNNGPAAYGTPNLAQGGPMPGWSGNGPPFGPTDIPSTSMAYGPVPSFSMANSGPFIGCRPLMMSNGSLMPPMSNHPMSAPSGMRPPGFPYLQSDQQSQHMPFPPQNFGMPCSGIPSSQASPRQHPGGAVNSPSICSSAPDQSQQSINGPQQSNSMSPMKNGNTCFSPSSSAMNGFHPGLMGDQPFMRPQMLPNGIGSHPGGNLPPQQRTFVFTSDMANKAISEMANGRCESMAAWHSQTFPPHCPMGPNGPMNPNSGAWSGPQMCQSGLLGRSPSVSNNLEGTSFPHMNGMIPGSNVPINSSSPNPAQSGRGTKRKASSQNATDQHQSPSPHLPPLSVDSKMMRTTTPGQEQQPASASSMPDYKPDFLRPPSNNNNSLCIPPISNSQNDDNPLNRLKAMTELCDTGPTQSNKMGKTDNATSVPTSNSGEAMNKEQKLAKLEEISRQMSISSQQEENSFPGNPVTMRRPMMPHGHPGFPPGHPGAPQFDAQMMAMMRGQAPMPGFHMPPGGPWNGMGPGGPGPGGPPFGLSGTMLMPGQPPNSSTGMPSPSFPPNGPHMMGMPPGTMGFPPGHPMGRQIGPGGPMPPMHPHMEGLQNGMMRGGMPPGMPDSAFGGWPPQHPMPQSLTNLDARVPVQKMQYFANNSSAAIQMQQQPPHNVSAAQMQAMSMQ
ncbi:hypothetical protein Ddc_01672 [Ditylenchus destructor]|nr:hypothetical protein Ddc_01672 [Ditylenchus destructor]